MKAVVYENYGGTEVLRINKVDRPSPKKNEVLIKVCAASINSWDWDMIRGEPIFVRMWGLTRPRHTIPGADIAGVVEAIGEEVTKFKPGDHVFGDLCENGWGGYAEYTCADVNALALKPSELSFEEAAAIPQAGLMAWQCLHDTARLSAGQRVLIIGAGGGVGTFAVNIAKSLGAEVTAEDRNDKHELLKTLGADHFIDYKKEDFTKANQSYDLIVDVVANHSLRDYSKCLRPQGRFLMVGGTTGAILQTMLFGRMYSRIYKRKLGLFPYAPNQGLTTFVTFLQNNQIKPVIDRCYLLDEVANAFRYYESGAVKGKIVITLK